jgi:hypothetical protein
MDGETGPQRWNAGVTTSESENAGQEEASPPALPVAAEAF